MILTYFYTILELSIKSLKEGTRIPNLVGTKDKSKIGHEKKNKVKQGAKQDFGLKLRVK